MCSAPFYEIFYIAKHTDKEILSRLSCNNGVTSYLWQKDNRVVFKEPFQERTAEGQEEQRQIL